jgi:hypothetical protein
MLPEVVVSPMVMAIVIPSLVDVVLPLADVAVASSFMAPVPPDPSARFATSLAIMPTPATNGLINLLKLTLSHHCRPFTPLPVSLLMIAGTQTQVLITTSLMT